MSEPDAKNESEVLKQVIDLLQAVTDDSRQRIFRALRAYFDFAAHGLNSANGPNSATSPLTREPSFGDRRSLSPKDFIHQKDPKTDVERVTCLAYYLTNYRDTPYFKTADISKLNTEAAQLKLSNPSYSIENAARAGLLTSGGSGSKQLSVHGEKVVLALPDRDKVREILKAVKRRSNRRKNRTDRSNGASFDSE